MMDKNTEERGLKAAKKLFEEIEKSKCTPYWLAFEVVCNGCIHEKNLKKGFCHQFENPKYIFYMEGCPIKSYRIYFNLNLCKKYFINIKGELK